MKKQNVFFLIAIIVLSSCSHTYYVPNTVNVPLFKEKNEIRLAGYYYSDQVTTYEIQGAYSITNNLAVMANYMYGYDYTKEYVKEDCGFGHYVDAAAEYYKPLNKYFVLEAFGGMGICNQSHLYKGEYLYASGHYIPTRYIAKVFFIKNFMQTSIGFTSNYFDIALSTRIANLTYLNTFQNLPPSDYDYMDLQKIYLIRNFLVLEPALTIRGGWKYVKIQTQLCYSFQVFPNVIIYRLPSEGGIFSAGLCFLFAERYYQKKQDKQPLLLP